MPAEVLNPPAASALDPNVRMDIRGAVYYPQDCHLAPEQFMAWLRDQLHKAGAILEWNTDVTGWQLDRSKRRIRKVHTNRGDFGEDDFEYIICGGSWSPAIARSLGLTLPMQPGKGYSLTLPHPPQLPSICAILTEARLAVTPMGQTLRFGGTMEIAGWDERINPVRVQGIIKSVPRYYPDFRAEHFSGVPVWRGLRPCSPDGLPYVGRVPEWTNLSVATGHAMQGLSLGPITGRLLSQVVSGESPTIDIGLLDPARFK
jgi:D-amino-acid dehydrogenase